jgi:hypothetical protein
LTGNSLPLVTKESVQSLEKGHCLMRYLDKNMNPSEESKKLHLETHQLLKKLKEKQK